MLFVPGHGLSRVLIDYEFPANHMRVRPTPEDGWRIQRIHRGTAKARIYYGEWVPVHPELTVERGL